MSGIEQIGKNEVRITIDTFKGVNRATHPTKLDIDEFELLENFVRLKQSGGGVLSKRKGIQVYNSNVLTASKAVKNIYEAKLYGAYYLLCKDSDGSGTSDLKYNSTANYTGAYGGTISTAEHEGYYRFATFKNKVYICNRVNTGASPDALVENKVWQSDTLTSLYPHGCVPMPRSSGLPLTFTSTADTNAGMTATGVYAYIITQLYDSYQESAGHDIFMRASTQKSMLIENLQPYNSRVTHFKIYRSVNLADALVPPEFMYLVATVPATDTTHRDTIEDANLGEAIPTEQLLDPMRPYRSKHITIAKERLIQGNLDDADAKYSALSSGDVTLTEGTATRLSGLDAGTYKYKIYKAYAIHAGGRYQYILGSPLEKSITVTGAGNRVTLTLSGGAFSDDWVDTFVIFRTTAGGNEFFCRTLLYQNTGTNYDIIGFNKSAFILGLEDELIDSGLVAGLGTEYKADFLTADSQIAGKYKNALAISEIGKGDRIPATSLKLLDIPDSLGITGLFTEDNRLVIFSASAIHTLDTTAQSSDYWTPDKVIEGVGAMGQPTAPNSEGTGHNGILQLPEGTGYLFFNRAYATTGQQIKAFYWNGQSYPEEISIPIDAYLNDGFSSFDIRGMTYDKVNNWVWTVVAYGSGVKRIFIFDLVYKQWYVWQPNNTVEMNDVVCLESGTVVIGAGDGRLLYYHPSLYYETYGATPTIYYFTTKLRTKTFDLYDADYIFKRLIVNCESSSNQIAFSTTSGDTTLTSEVAGATTVNNLTVSNTASTTWHRIRVPMNIKTRKAYLQLTNIETKGITINSIILDAKIKHKRDGSR